MLRDRGQLDSFARLSSTGNDPWESVDTVISRVRASVPALPIAAPRQPPTQFGARELTETQRLEAIHNHEVLWPMPTIPLTLLHYLTLGVFTFFWVLSRHGQLPVTRGTDSSAANAIGRCFIPFYQLYWFFIVFPRLADRVNAVSAANNLPKVASKPLGHVLAALLAVPCALMTAGGIILALLWFSTSSVIEAFIIFFAAPSSMIVLAYLVIGPVFAKQIQVGINRVFEAQVVALRNAARS